VHQGIERGAITTVHDVTNTQTVVDACNSKKSDLRRARSSLISLTPTSTGMSTDQNYGLSMPCILDFFTGSVE